MLDFNPINYIKLNYPKQFESCVQALSSLKKNENISFVAYAAIAATVYFASSKLFGRGKEEPLINDPNKSDEVMASDVACTLGKCAAMCIMIWGLLDLVNKSK